MQKQQQNTTNKSRFADTALVCLRLPGPTFGIDETHWQGTYAGKSRGTLLNYSCGPKAIHQNSCCTVATLHPCILYRRVSVFCFAPVERVSGNLARLHVDNDNQQARWCKWGADLQIYDVTFIHFLKLSLSLSPVLHELLYTLILYNTQLLWVKGRFKN